MGGPSTHHPEGFFADILSRIQGLESRLARGRSVRPADVGLHPGIVQAYAGTTAPSGWLLCDGSTVSRADYPDLFETIGTTFGAGDGSTTFALPDMRGRVPVGQDAGQTEFDMMGEKGGAKTHTLTVDQIPSHNHAAPSGYFYVETNNGNMRKSAVNTQAGSSGENGVWRQRIAESSGALPTASAGGGAAHNNLQPYIVLNYIIKA